MSKNTSHTPTKSTTSALERLNLAFEYNVTWAEEKKSLKERTL
ncbi:MAG: hypothetical protein WBO49_01820 [Candidatus Saccharimonas sp.]